ncbi:MAG: sigma-54 dependent transcriptional regulator [Desulfococcaceae bacterium]|jgi:DNA-binding NtrC family response regulator|nr:sigma-54 dependent transcriptional regulator [Desulfococcaceae bacterium]
MNSVMVVSSDQRIIKTIFSALSDNYDLIHVACRNKALEYLQKKRRDILFVDAEILPDTLSVNKIRESLRPFRDLYPSIEIVIMTPAETIRNAVRAVKAGASDYLTYPIIADEVRLVVQNLTESEIMESELEYLREQQWRSDSLDIVNTKNVRMRDVFRSIKSVAPTKTTVLLMGETGVGKGVLAKLIHQHSNREDARFISVHCGAIPDSLIESELFGHEKGAFTGAIRKKLGKFEIAKNGSIFLDEIGTVTPPVQIKLLRVLQDKSFCRVGGDRDIESDTRVIAASNADLRAMSDRGEFRKDLYYRLNVFPIEIPPLRERPEDIPALVLHFLRKMNSINAKAIHDVHSDVYDALIRYSWPGNIRELENLIERAYILENSSILTAKSFPAELFERRSLPLVPIEHSLPIAEARRRIVADFEKKYIRDLLERHKGRIRQSAQEAGITTRQLHKLMIKSGIRKENFKI